MTLAQFISDFGYLAVAVGSFLEGEAVLLAGSLAAYHGHLDMAVVLPIAAIFSFLGDLPYFFAGRRYGPAVLRRYPVVRRRRQRIEKLLNRHCVVLVLTLRFLYGFRIAGLLALGMSKIAPARFLALDFLGAVLWASVVCATGYGVAQVLVSAFGAAITPEQVSLLAVLLVATWVAVSALRRLVPRGQ